MKDFKRITTEHLWKNIELNAQYAKSHMNWVELLDNIKVLCELIDERVQVFQRKIRREQLLKEHRGKFEINEVKVKLKEGSNEL